MEIHRHTNMRPGLWIRKITRGRNSSANSKSPIWMWTHDWFLLLQLPIHLTRYSLEFVCYYLFFYFALYTITVFEINEKDWTSSWFMPTLLVIWRQMAIEIRDTKEVKNMLILFNKLFNWNLIIYRMCKTNNGHKLSKFWIFPLSI